MQIYIYVNYITEHNCALKHH